VEDGMPATRPFAARPDPSEHAPYYGTYVAEVPDGDILATLQAQGRDTRALLSGVDEASAARRYAPGKWSVKEVVGHVADSERVFAVRALAFSRGERAGLFGFDENAWAAEAGFDRRPLRDVADELAAVREATIRLFGGLSQDQWLRRGVANGVEFTVRALAWIVAGHERHHVAVLRDRYL